VHHDHRRRRAPARLRAHGRRQGAEHRFVAQEGDDRGVARAPSGQANVANEVKLAFATGGKLTNLLGGLPIVVDGHVIGAIGVGSGTGEQDLEVAKAAIAALPGAKQF
jgi:hypothetical protein